jgi:hypothetical protein
LQSQNTVQFDVHVTNLTPPGSGVTRWRPYLALDVGEARAEVPHRILIGVFLFLFRDVDDAIDGIEHALVQLVHAGV